MLLLQLHHFGECVRSTVTALRLPGDRACVLLLARAVAELVVLDHAVRRLRIVVQGIVVVVVQTWVVTVTLFEALVRLVAAPEHVGLLAHLRVF